MSHQQLTQKVPALSIGTEPPSPFITDCHRIALDHLRRAFTEAQSLAVLIGEGKSGASFVIRSFLDSIEDDVAVVRITEPWSDAIAGMREVIHAIGFDPKDMGPADLENVFAMFLSFQKTHRQRTVICIEDTQDNARWVLDQVRRLVELEMKGKFGLIVILSGRPSLNVLLNQPPLNAIAAEAGERIYLEPFTLGETKEYIRRRIESAGTAHVGQLFEFDAITLLHELCEGIPDAVSNLCSECLQLADEEDTGPVTTELVKRAGELLRLPSVMQQSDAEAGSVEVNEVSPPIGRLIARLNGEIVQEQTLNQGHILIGRDVLSDIRLDSPPVSRHHALVINSSNGIKLVDLGSTNGTLVNGRQVKRYTLQDSDVITVGDCRINYVAGDYHQGWFFDIDLTDSFAAHITDLAPPGKGNGRKMQPLDPEKTTISSGTAALIDK